MAQHDFFSGFERAGVASIAIDANERIILWNLYAERLFGLSRTDTLGRRCYEVLCGRDVFGNRYCASSCPLTAMRGAREAIRPADLVVRCGDREQRVTMVTISFGEESHEPILVHLFTASSAQNVVESPQPVSVPSRLPVVGDRSTPSHPRSNLTPREIEVLRLLADGRDTGEIARGLSISRATVRNHVQHILDKLGAKGRLEAVLQATRQKLI